MQFLFLLYGDEAAELAMTPQQRRAMVDEHVEYSRGLRERGAGHQFQFPVHCGGAHHGGERRRGERRFH